MTEDFDADAVFLRKKTPAKKPVDLVTPLVPAVKTELKQPKKQKIGNDFQDYELLIDRILNGEDVGQTNNRIVANYLKFVRHIPCLTGGKKERQYHSLLAACKQYREKD